MKEITLIEYTEAKKARRNKESVAKKLEAFLQANVSTLKKDKAYVINASDFLSVDAVDFHYYTALKMLREKFANLDAQFNLQKNGRASKIMIKVK